MRSAESKIKPSYKLVGNVRELIPPTEFDLEVAQTFLDLESNVPELKALHFVKATEISAEGDKKAIVISVEVSELKNYKKIHQRLTRELEKKFSDRHVVFIGDRQIHRPHVHKASDEKPVDENAVLYRKTYNQPIPRSRTKKAVNEATLDDLVYPAEIVGKRLKFSTLKGNVKRGLKQETHLKVLLDVKYVTEVEHKIDSFVAIYRKLTGHQASFEFPAKEEQ